MHKQKVRDEIKEEDTWDLTLIYKNDQEFYNDLEKIKKDIKNIKKYEKNIDFN